MNDLTETQEKNEELITELILLVFDKAQEASRKTNEYGLSKYLSDYFTEEYNSTLELTTFRRYYKGYVSKVIKKIIPNEATRDILAKYLEFENYESFLKNSECEIAKRKLRTALRNTKSIWKKRTSISLLLFIITFIALSLLALRYEEKNCMIWTGGHFEKIKCSGTKNEENLDPIRLKEFKQVYFRKCDTFFLWDNPDEPIIWYDKSKNKVTLFTAPGIHPTNRKTLKPITQTIIDNHIEPCP